MSANTIMVLRKMVMTTSMSMREGMVTITVMAMVSLGHIPPPQLVWTSTSWMHKKST